MMTTSTVDQLVNDYLARLTRAAEGLPPDRRGELLEEISEHIASARAAGAAADEAAVRTLLDRLGDPDEIVASARDDGSERDRPGFVGLPSYPAPPRKPSTTLETVAVAMLTVGSIIPVLGWLVGVVLLWVSQRWRWWEKLVATVIVPFGPFGALIFFGLFVTTTSSASCSGSSPSGPVCTSTDSSSAWIGPTLAISAVLAPLVIGGYLLVVAGRRAKLEAAAS